jgi:hypothetical protein
MNLNGHVKSQNKRLLALRLPTLSDLDGHVKSLDDLFVCKSLNFEMVITHTLEFGSSCLILN